MPRRPAAPRAPHTPSPGFLAAAAVADAAARVVGAVGAWLVAVGAALLLEPTFRGPYALASLALLAAIPLALGGAIALLLSSPSGRRAVSAAALLAALGVLPSITDYTGRLVADQFGANAETLVCLGLSLLAPVLLMLLPFFSFEESEPLLSDARLERAGRRLARSGRVLRELAAGVRAARPR
jgi:hypothetical protein